MSQVQTTQRSSSSAANSQVKTCSSGKSSKKHVTSAPAVCSSTKLHPQDLQAALLNFLYPRNCESLNVLGHEFKALEKYPHVLRLKAVYSLMVENQVKQFTVDFLVKVLPEAIEAQRLFSRELSFYRYIEPELRQVIVQTMQSPLARSYLARGECEAPKHSNPSFPKQRGPPEPGCSIDCAPSLLVLQDLTREGLRKASPSKEMDFLHCAAALRALAGFHAISATVDRSDPKLKKGSYLATAFPFIMPDRGLFSETEKLFDKGMKIIAILGPHMDPKILLPDRDVAKVVRFMKRNLLSLLVEILSPHPTQLNTLCHTNCSNASNFLFIFDQRHRPCSSKLIGLSKVRYCRPAVDISLVIYCAGDRDVRTNKVKLLLEVYRDEFNKILESCQKKHHKTLPYSAGLLSVQQLNESMDGTKLLGAAHRAMVVATEFASGDKSNLSLSERALREFARDDTYRARVTEAVSDLLSAVEPYVGDCSLSTDHRNCPHFLPRKIEMPKNLNHPKPEKNKNKK